VKHSVTTLNERLFICSMPCGISYADRGREEHGDYKRLAFHAYSSGALEFYRGSDPWKEMITAHAAQTPNGTRVSTSCCGQYVTMGHGVLKGDGR